MEKQDSITLQDIQYILHSRYGIYFSKQKLRLVLRENKHCFNSIKQLIAYLDQKDVILDQDTVDQVKYPKLYN